MQFLHMNIILLQQPKIYKSVSNELIYFVIITMNKSQIHADGQFTITVIVLQTTDYAPLHTTLINNKANLTPTTRYCKQKKMIINYKWMKKYRIENNC